MTAVPPEILIQINKKSLSLRTPTFLEGQFQRSSFVFLFNVRRMFGWVEWRPEGKVFTASQKAENNDGTQLKAWIQTGSAPTHPSVTPHPDRKEVLRELELKDKVQQKQARYDRVWQLHFSTWDSKRPGALWKPQKAAKDRKTFRAKRMSIFCEATVWPLHTQNFWHHVLKEPKQTRWLKTKQSWS